MRRILIILSFLSFSLFIQAQSGQEIKILGIKTKQSWINSGPSSRYLDKTEKFDANGNKIEEIEYSKEETVKYHFVWTYNSNNDILTETELDETGKIKKKTVYEYNGRLRVSKKEYNEKNKLVSWKTYTYEKN